MTFLNFVPIFAANQVQNPLDQLGVQPAPRNLLGMRATDMLLIISITLLLGLILLAWAVYFRKPKAERGPRNFNSRPYVEERDDGTIRKRKKRKRQRRDHRQRNPTLAEVGGLPPPKGHSAPPPI
jgi:hypothetical protein